MTSSSHPEATGASAQGGPYTAADAGANASTAGAGAARPVLAAVCGLPCEACSIYIGSHEDPERLARFAARMGWDVADAYCDGCRAETRTPYCRACRLYACAEQRGHQFCIECADYPCAELDEFKRQRPHRIELYDNLARIRDIGAEAWLAEAREHYACPECATINSTYDLACRKCGHEPGNAYVATHKEAILEMLARG